MKVVAWPPEMLHVVYNTIDAEGIYEAADRVAGTMPKGIERAFKILVPRICCRRRPSIRRLRRRRC